MKFLNILIIFSFFFFLIYSSIQTLDTNHSLLRSTSGKLEVRSEKWKLTQKKKTKQTSKNKNKNKNKNRNTLTPTATQTETETTMRYLPLGKRRWD